MSVDVLKGPGVSPIFHKKPFVVWLWKINYISKFGEIPFPMGSGHRYRSALITLSFFYLCLVPTPPNRRRQFLRPSWQIWFSNRVAWLNFWSLIRIILISRQQTFFPQTGLVYTIKNLSAVSSGQLISPSHFKNPGLGPYIKEFYFLDLFTISTFW